MIPFLPTTWRLIRTNPARGAWNMAVDEAILESSGRGETPPTLRLYAWQPACLSLGYAQPFSDVDLAALAAHGWDLVRRPTGGRAILHTDELTYSVAGPQDEPRLAGSVLESYRILSGALLQALHRLNLPAVALAHPQSPPGLQTGSSPRLPLEDPAAAPSTQNAPVNPVCFEVPSNYEITVDGKKLIGSAQARRKHGVLQHGSLPLCGDLGRITQALVFPEEAERLQATQRLLERATTAEKILGYPLEWEDAARAFAEAFQETLNLELIPGELSEAELAQAQELVHAKYANPEWTNRL